ncbi:MAG: alpha-1,2-fucosyltransferase [Sediminibacterium sp.]
MIISEPNSGLGNQLFQYAAARSLALNTEQKLIIDNGFFLADNYRQPKLQYFTNGANFIIPPHKLLNKISKTLEYYWQNKIQVVHDSDWWQYNDYILKLPLERYKHIKLTGSWCSLKYFQSSEEVIKKELDLKPKYSYRLDNILHKISNTNSVAIHIRKGDYVNSDDAKKIFFNLDIGYYLRAIEYIGEQVNNPIYYIFTNDNDWVKLHLKKIKLKNVEYISEKAIFLDYEEFELMKKCKHQIIANSTFSWWAAFLNKNHNKIIVQPQKWYNDQIAQENYENGNIIGKIGDFII